MARDMRTITISKRSKAKTLHVEAPGCIVNIHVGLTNMDGQAVTHVSISADGNRYRGDLVWWIDGKVGADHLGVRVIREN